MTAPVLARALLRVRLLGSLELNASGRPLPPDIGGSRKARSLLKLLVLYRGAIAPHDVIIDALWGDRPPAKPEENIAALVSRLRASLGAELLSRGAGGYRLIRNGPVSVAVDAEDAERLVDQAEGDLRAHDVSLALVAAAQALALLERGPLLADEPPRNWVLDARARGNQLTRRARRVAWTAGLALRDWPVACDSARRAVEVDVLDEEAHRAYMIAAHLGGETASALDDYERLRRALASQLGVAPDPQTAAVHLALLRGQPLDLPVSTTAARAPFRRSVDPVFVGRSAELRHVGAVWRDALGGRGGLVLVSGEAGIGKSHFAREAATAASASGGLVLSARCYEAESSLFLQPVLEAVRAAIALLSPDVVRSAAGSHGPVLAELLPDAAPLLLTAPARRGHPEWERRRSFDAIVALLRGFARQQPLLLVIDDLHCAGASTVELLHYLVRRLAAERVLVLTTLRSEEGEGASAMLADVADVVELAALPDIAVIELAQQMGVPDIAPRVVELARGHPLFAVELLRAAVDGAEPGADEIPGSLRSAVLTRARRCGSDVEELLRAAAVVGTAARLDQLGVMLQLDRTDVSRRAERAADARLLVESGVGWSFSHELVRQIFYLSIPRPLRDALHRAAALVLAEQPEAAAAQHVAARDWGEATNAYEAAARRAEQAMAYREAVALLDAALEATSYHGDSAAAARLRLRRGQLRSQLGDTDGARDDHAAVLQIAVAADDDDLEATARERLAWLAYHARDLRTAGELVDRAAAAGRARPSAMALAGRLQHSAGDLTAAARSLREAIAAVDDDHQIDDAALAATARMYLGGVLVDRGEYGAALHVLDRARRDCRRAGALLPMLGAISYGASARVALGDLTGALAQLERMARLSDELECRPCRPRALIQLAHVRLELGDADEALRLAGAAQEAAVGLPATLRDEFRLAALLVAAAATADVDELGAVAALLAEADDLLDPDIPYSWLYRLHYLEVLMAVDAAAAPVLLAAAQERGAMRFVCLALSALGRRAEAAALARNLDARTLLAKVAPRVDALAAVELIAAQLAFPVRDRYVARARARVAAGRCVPRSEVVRPPARRRR